MSAKTLKAIAEATELIQAYDVHEAGIELAYRLKLNAEVRTCIGKWDERGSIIGWAKSGNVGCPTTVLIEVFVSDIAGEDREFNRYARRIQSLIDENAALKARLEGLLA